MNNYIVEDIDNDVHNTSNINKKSILRMPTAAIITISVSALLGYCFTVYTNGKLGCTTKLTINNGKLSLVPVHSKIVAIQSVA